MRDLDDTILRQLATCPFLSAADLEVRWGVATATMARALTRLRAAGLVERVPLGDDKTFLYAPIGDGAIAAAASAAVDLTALCRIYGLDRRQLMARLPLLKRLVPAQRFIMDLASDLEEGVGGRLGFYKAGPLHWHAAGRGGPRGEVLLDGMGRIDVVAGATRADVSYWFGRATRWGSSGGWHACAQGSLRVPRRRPDCWRWPCRAVSSACSIRSGRSRCSTPGDSQSSRAAMRRACATSWAGCARLTWSASIVGGSTPMASRASGPRRAAARGHRDRHAPSARTARSWSMR